jgi:hypothetical protein
MISEFKFPDRDWQLYIKNVDLDYYLKFIKKFEDMTQPIEKKKSFWHDTFSEYVLKEFKNNKIRIDYSDEIVTIMFTESSTEDLKQLLKTIAQTIANEFNTESPQL